MLLVNAKVAAVERGLPLNERRTTGATRLIKIRPGRPWASPADPIAAGFLGTVHGFISNAQQLLFGLTVVGGECHADARRYSSGPADRPSQRAAPAQANFFCHRQRIVAGLRNRAQHWLVTANARGGIGFAQTGLDPLRHRLRNSVTHFMPCSSLIGLKRSRSMNRSASRDCSRLARLINCGSRSATTGGWAAGSEDRRTQVGEWLARYNTFGRCHAYAESRPGCVGVQRCNDFGRNQVAILVRLIELDHPHRIRAFTRLPSANCLGKN